MKRTVTAFAAALLFAAVLLPTIAWSAGFQKDINRKFPSNYCPIPMDGSVDGWTTDTGSVRITFIFSQGFNFNPLDIRLDDVTVITLSEWNLLSAPDPSCLIEELLPGDITGNPSVPLYETFDPVQSACPWDETLGGTITNGEMQFVDPGVGGTVSTSVLLSGLSTSESYILWGRWHAVNFQENIPCTDDFGFCVSIIVEDVPSGCALPVEESTWGHIKALYDE